MIQGQHAVCVLQKRTQRQSCLMQAVDSVGTAGRLSGLSQSVSQKAACKMPCKPCAQAATIMCHVRVPCRAAHSPPWGAVAYHWTGSPAFLLCHLSGCLWHLSGCRFCLLQTWAVLAWGLVKSGALLAGWSGVVRGVLAGVFEQTAATASKLIMCQCL